MPVPFAIKISPIQSRLFALSVLLLSLSASSAIKLVTKVKSINAVTITVLWIGLISLSSLPIGPLERNFFSFKDS